MDGAPRVMIDFFGKIRDQKKVTKHLGIDIAGVAGEPVRAIAPGRVAFTGIDIPGRGRSRPLSPWAASKVPNREMGPGGRFVRINHENGFSSIYMHLQSINLREGRTVQAGQKIGTVGRSGTITSGPHLHLEIRIGPKPVNPSVPLSPFLINPFSIKNISKKKGQMKFPQTGKTQQQL